MANKSDVAIPTERIERAILLIRGQKVMLDADLAAMYGVTTSNLNKAVSRNKERFPADFMFPLTDDEAENLRFQFGISKTRGGRRYAFQVFTEQGVAMLSSHADLARRFDDLERKYDQQFAVVFQAIRELMKPPRRKTKEIGYHTLVEKK